MKKRSSRFFVMVLVAIAAIFVTILLIYHGKTDTDLALSAYEYAQSDQITPPKLTLKEQKQFDFFYAVESSYQASGTYQVNHQKLYLETSDGQYIFVFSIQKESLVFELDQSTLPPDFINVEDQAVFVPIDE